jgi:ferrous iron transport protein A
MLQLSGNTETVATRNPMPGTHHRTSPLTLANLRKGEAVVLDRIELPADVTQRLMELGFVPGAHVSAGCCAPGGDPRVFQVDGSEIALRRETASHIIVHGAHAAHGSHPRSR